MLKPNPLYINEMSDLSEIGLMAFAHPDRIEEYLDRLVASAYAPVGRMEDSQDVAGAESRAALQPALPTR